MSLHRIGGAAALLCIVLGPASAAAQPAPDLPPPWAPTQELPYVVPPPPPALELPPPPPPPGADWQLALTLSGGLYSEDGQGTSWSTSGKRASGGVQLSRFLSPVVDDGAPRSVEPFLQRTSSLWWSLWGGGFVTTNPYPGGADRSNAYVEVATGLDIYLARFIALTASLDYTYDVLRSPVPVQESHLFAGSAGLGFRFDDTRLDVSYTFSARKGEQGFAPLRWGRVSAGVYSLIGRRFALRPWAVALEHGGGGGLDLGLYATQNLGFFLSGYGERGWLYSNDMLVNRASGDAGFSYWVASRVRLGVDYTLTFNDVPAQLVDQVPVHYRELDHALTLTAVVRL